MSVINVVVDRGKNKSSLLFEGEIFVGSGRWQRDCRSNATNDDVVGLKVKLLLVTR